MTGHRVRWMLVVAGLGLMSAAVSRAEAPARDSSPMRRSPRLLAVFIGGMDSDPTAEQIAGTAPRGHGNSGMFQLCNEVRGEQVIAEYFNWNGTRAGELKIPNPPRSAGISAFVRVHLQHHAWDRVALVGNSWGGHTAFEVTQELRKEESPLAVSLTIFLDASSTGRAQRSPTEFPENVNRIVQYRTRNAFVWPTLPRQGRLESIDLGNPSAGYLRDRGPAYNAPFDIKAHVAAEWDDRIHADIRRRLMELVPSERVD